VGDMMGWTNNWTRKFCNKLRSNCEDTNGYQQMGRSRCQITGFVAHQSSDKSTFIVTLFCIVNVNNNIGILSKRLQEKN
jgi:hypothetical protein